MMTFARSLYALAATLAISAQTYAGCDSMLRDGIFNAFNSASYRYASDRWHMAWCNGTLEKVNYGNKSGASLKLGAEDFNVGLTFDDATKFQSTYQQTYCGNRAREAVDLSQDQVYRKTVDPSLMDAYVQCRKIEMKGLETDFAINKDGKAFSITMRYSQPFEVGKAPRVKSVSFKPKSSLVSCSGELTKVPRVLNANSDSMHCERVSSQALSILIDTDAGPFSRDIEAVPAPPTDQEKVMGALPRGTILMWAAKTPVPAGWVICDGNFGTPDLRDRYASGTDAADKVGERFGQEKHKHSGTGSTNYGHHRGFNAVDGAFQKEGNNASNHDHELTITTDEQPNLPPSVKVMFIMKV